MHASGMHSFASLLTDLVSGTSVLVLDPNAAPVVNHFSLSSDTTFKSKISSTVWLDDFIKAPSHNGEFTILINLQNDTNFANLNRLPTPLPGKTNLVVIHPTLTERSLNLIVGLLKPQAFRVWNPYPLKTVVSHRNLLSLSPLVPTRDHLLNDYPSLNIQSFVSSLLALKDEVNPIATRITLLGNNEKFLAEFKSIYLNSYNAYLNSLTDKQKSIVETCNQIPNSNHLTIIDRNSFLKPLNLIDTSYLGIVSQYFPNFSAIKLKDTDITFNLFNESDPILPLLIGQDFSNVPNILNSLAKALKSSFEKKDHLNSIDEIKDFVADLSNLEMKRNWLAKHTNLVTEIFSLIDPSVKINKILDDNIFSEDESNFSEFNSKTSIESQIIDYFPLKSNFNFIKNSGSVNQNSIFNSIKTYIIKFSYLGPHILFNAIKLINLLNNKDPLSFNQQQSLIGTLSLNFPINEVLSTFKLNENELQELPELPSDTTHVVFLGPVTPSELNLSVNTILFSNLAL